MEIVKGGGAMEREPARCRPDSPRPSCASSIATALITCVALLACAQMQKDEPVGPAASEQPPPPWAYLIQPAVTPPPDDGVPRHVPNSNLELTLTQIRNLFVPPDWHPEDHPPMPGVVGTGRKPGTFACGYC